MALEDYLDSNSQSSVSIGAGGCFDEMWNSISLPENVSSDAQVTSHKGFSFENMPTSMVNMACLNANLVSKDMDSTVLNNSKNSQQSVAMATVLTNSTNLEPSVSVSSFDMDANWPLQSGTQFRTNRESCFNLPPQSNKFSTSVINGPYLAHQISHLDKSSRPGCKIQQPQWQSSSSATTATLTRQFSLPITVEQEPGFLNEICKKPRRDFYPEDVLRQQNIQQFWQRQNYNAQLQASIQQQRFQNQPQRHILPSIPQFGGVQIHPQKHKQQMGGHLQHKAICQVSTLPPIDNAAICARRLMKYLYHLRHRPDNSIANWSKFIAEYYAPGATKRWCVSLYENFGEQALGVSSMAAKEAWHCDICGSKSGKGYEAKFELLPRLCKIEFDNGVLDELLFLDLLYEGRSPTGLMMLEYRKAVQETVYEKFRVVREDQLRLTFTHDLKILSWEFCVRHHEELLSRSLVVPQVNQLLLAEQKYMNTINNGVSDGVSPQDLHSNCNMLLTELSRNLEEEFVNELGFSRSHAWCLEISDVVNTMKDLMTFSLDRNIGPLESLNSYRQGYAITNNEKKKEMEQRGSAHCMLTKSTLPGPSNMMMNTHITNGESSSTGRIVNNGKSCCRRGAISSPLAGFQSSGSAVLLQKPPIGHSNGRLNKKVVCESNELVFDNTTASVSASASAGAQTNVLSNFRNRERYQGYIPPN